jgi:peptidoglycan/LPS O-acetylase OafA/YrhL
MEYIEAFNGFRGYGFLNVVLDHYTYPTGRVLDFGQYGVGMFYVLSSYLLTLILYTQYLEKGTLNLINYIIRRFFRIYPILTIALILEYFLGRFDLRNLIGIFFLYNLKGVYWTIYIEMRFYVIIPLIVWIFANIKNSYLKFSFMGVITIIGYVYHYYLNFILDGKSYRRWDISGFKWEKNIVFVNYLPIFLFGSFMAIIVYHLKKTNYNFNSYSFLKGIFILFMSLIHFPLIAYRSYKGDEPVLWDLPWSNLNSIFCVGYVFIFLFFHGENFMSKFFGLKPIAFFGNISYPGYLLHTIVRDFFFLKLNFQKTSPILISSFFITIIISYILHITIETYFINLTKFWFYIKTEKKDNEISKNAYLNNEKIKDDNNIDKSNSIISTKERDTEINTNDQESQSLVIYFII